MDRTLVFYGADSQVFPQPPDLDPEVHGNNAKINGYISGLMEPIGSVDCPKDALGVQACATFNQTVRARIPNTLFLTETPFLPSHPAGYVGADAAGPSSLLMEGLRPIFTTFSNY